jgi:hypothetical protein
MDTLGSLGIRPPRPRLAPRRLSKCPSGRNELPLHFIAGGFAPEEAFAPESLSHGIWWRIKKDTRFCPESKFQPSKQYFTGGRVRKENGRMIVDGGAMVAFSGHLLPAPATRFYQETAPGPHGIRNLGAGQFFGARHGLFFVVTSFTK